jgi:hypothetical protein
MSNPWILRLGFALPVLYIGLIGCSSYRKAYCKHCWMKDKLNRTGVALAGLIPEPEDVIESAMDDAIDSAVGDGEDEKEISRDTKRLHDGRPLRYHENAADLRWHRQQQAMSDFEFDDDDL